MRPWNSAVAFQPDEPNSFVNFICNKFSYLLVKTVFNACGSYFSN